MSENEEYLSAGEAAAYLAKKWGMPSYKASAFKTLRYRWNIQPAIVTSNASLWKKSDLDSIPKPTRGRPKRGGQDEGEEGGNPLVISAESDAFLASSYAAISA